MGTNEIKDMTIEYISKSLKRTNSYDMALRNLRKLSLYFKEIKYIPTQDDCVLLIKSNAILNYLLELIVNKTLNDKENNDLTSISNDEIVNLFITCYCMINNIDLMDSIDDLDFEKAIELDDSVKYIDIEKLYMQEIKKPLLTPEEERSLLERIAQGDERAKTTFIERNLRLVVKIAYKNINRGVPFLDLVQEGNIGLLKALERFDYTKGFKFSTYATWWIKQSINRTIADTSRNIRIPVHVYEDLGKFRKAKLSLEKRLGYTPSITEIAEELGIKEEKAKKLSSLLDDTISFDTPIGDDGTILADFIPSSEESLEDQVLSSILSEDIKNAIKECYLDAREIIVLTKRFGLDGNQPETLENLAKELGITRERVRQIEIKVIKKLRRSEGFNNIAEGMGYKKNIKWYY